MLTKEQKRYINEKASPTVKIRELADALHVDYNKVQHWLNYSKLPYKKTRRYIDDPAIVNTIKENYMTCPLPKIAEMTGISRTKIASIMRELGLDIQDPARLAVIKEHQRKAFSASLKTTYRHEKYLLQSGLAQNTKMKISLVPQKTRYAINSLKTRYNYFQDKKVGGDYTLYYDSETRRTPNEQHFAEKYKLKFVEA